MVDPFQHLLKSQEFQLHAELRFVAFGQLRVMQPHPKVSEDQAHAHKEQPQMRIACAGENLGLSSLSIAGFDSEPLAITLANFGGRTLHAPRRKQQLLLLAFFVFAILVCAIAHANRNGHFSRLVLHYVRIPARLLTANLSQARQFASRLGPATANNHRHQKPYPFLLEPRDHRDVEERAIQQQMLDFQAEIANPSDQPLQHLDQRIAAADPSHRDRVSLSVMHNARRGVSVKLGGALLGLARAKLVFGFHRLAVIGHLVVVDGHTPSPAFETPRPLARQRLIEAVLQNQSRLGQTLFEGNHHGIAFGRSSQIPAGGVNRKAAGGRSQHDVENHHRSTKPAAILRQIRFEQSGQRPLMHLAAGKFIISP